MLYRNLPIVASLVLAGCAGRNARLVRQLESELIACKDLNQSLKVSLATCGSPENDSVYQTLYQVFSGSELQIEQRGTATTIMVEASHIYSDVYGLQFREEADNNIDLLGTALLLNPDHRVLVIGHTSDRPIPEEWESHHADNMHLSVALSHTLAEHLEGNYGHRGVEVHRRGSGAVLAGGVERPRVGAERQHPPRESCCTRPTP